ncbi:MAG: DivIVA domain-containing protein [Coriobacteriia bacterium]|nr:DivIVA domain-containing protein [Coriobacteriia bacterium]
MKLTPLDIHHKEFGHALRGYNEAEVDAFLDQVADELERLFKENIDLSERIEALEDKVRGYQDMERTLHNTLVSAQKSADELMQQTRNEAEAVLREAELKAKEVIHSALTSKQKATSDLARIKQAEEAFRAEFKRVLEGHLRSLAEIPVSEDVTLLTGTAGEEMLAEAEVFAPGRPAATVSPEITARPTATVAAEPPSHEPVAEPKPSAPEPTEPPESGFVASLHLGDLGDSAPDPDATVSFDVAEFGYGEREEDVDIEEID